MEQTAIILVDLQGDFTQMENGSLAVEDTDKKYLDTIIENLNYLKDKGFKIFATQDWHPKEHVSFFTNNKGTQPYDIIENDGLDQVMWPPHCVQDTENADILVKTDMFTSIIKKGQNIKFDSYSGFQDDGGIKTDLKEILNIISIKKIVIFGLTTDYCVKFTALDGIKAGFKVVVIENLCRGVAPDSTDRAIKEMREKGVLIIPEIDLKKITQF